MHAKRSVVAELLRYSKSSSHFLFDFVMVAVSSFQLLSFLHGHCVPSSTVFGYNDPSFVGLIAALDWVFIFFKFLFEEFVDIIFPSFSRSSNRPVGPVS